MIFAIDYLGGARYKGAILKAHRPGLGAGFFSKLDGFGDALPVADALAASGKCPWIRLHAMWKDGHGYTRADFPAIVKEARRIQALAAKHPDIQWAISGACEHKLNAKDAGDLANLVKMAAPSCVYVNTPMEGGAFLPGERNEIHAKLNPGHSPVPNFDFSFDGQPCTDRDVEAFKAGYSKANVFYMWDARLNNQWEYGDSVPRPEREGMADEKFIRSLNALCDPCGQVHLPKGYLWKSHAENHGNGDARAEHPVFICPDKAAKAQLIAENGKLVAELPYYGTYGPRFRYYGRTWGFEMARTAIALSGKPLCQIKVGKKVVGIVNPAFRLNEYH